MFRAQRKCASGPPNVTPRRYRESMTTLDELKEQVEGLRHVVRMADSDSMETRQLLRAQTRLMMALRSGQLDLNIEQKNIKVVLGYQAEALAGMLLSLTSMQDRFNSLDRDVTGLSENVAGLQAHAVRMEQRQDRAEQRQDRAEQRQDRAEQRQDRAEQRQDRMDRNVVAIMRHLGVEAGEES
jgi:chromosome segregation ATPase